MLNSKEEDSTTTPKLSRKATKRELKKAPKGQCKEKGQNVLGSFFGKILNRSKSPKDGGKQSQPLEVSIKEPKLHCLVKCHIICLSQ